MSWDISTGPIRVDTAALTIVVGVLLAVAAGIALWAGRRRRE